MASSSSYSKKNSKTTSQTSESNPSKADKSSHKSKYTSLLRRLHIGKSSKSKVNITSSHSENQNLDDKVDTTMERSAENSFILSDSNAFTLYNIPQPVETLSLSSMDDSSEEPFFDALDDQKELKGRNFAQSVNDTAGSEQTPLEVGEIRMSGYLQTIPWGLANEDDRFIPTIFQITFLDRLLEKAKVY